MFIRTQSGWKRLAATLAALLALGLVAAALVVWSGVYNVSAARDHLGVTTWLLEQVRDRSIATRGALVDVPELDNPGLSMLGGAHYEGACVPCHARPEDEIPEVVSHMLPPPPHLSRALAENTTGEIFWVVKNGLKYTGMPAFPTQERDDEVWAVTSFLSRLTGGEPLEDYRALAGLDRLPDTPRTDSGPATRQISDVRSLTQCIRCHDGVGLPTHADVVPRLAGQSAPYLRRSLLEYATGDRASGIMQPVADALSAADIDRLVAHYSGLKAEPAAGSSRSGDIGGGRRLAQSGDREAAIPPCLACHGASGSILFPKLAGQNADYIEGQLRLWQNGGRDGTTYGQIMAPIARRLSAEQIRDVAAYFHTLGRQSARAAAGPAGAEQ